MIRALALVALCVGCLLLLGGSKAHRLTVKTLNEPRLLTVIVTLHDVTETYRYLSVYGCAAELTEDGVQCTYAFERESSYELAGARKQHLVYWRDLPRGTMQLTAMAFDAERKRLAEGRAVVFR